MKKIGVMLGIIFLSGLFFSGSSVQAEESANNPVAVLKEVEGQLQIVRGGANVQGKMGDSLYVGDELVTGAKDRALIEFSSDQTLVKMTYDSTLRLTGREEQGDSQSRILLVRGLMWGKKVGEAVPLRIRTPVAVLAVRGTEFFVKVLSDDISQIVVKEGHVDITYGDYRLQAGAMSLVTVEKDKAPMVEGLSQEIMAQKWISSFA